MKSLLFCGFLIISIVPSLEFGVNIDSQQLIEAVKMQKTVKFDGLELWTESFGSPKDPAILLIGGMCASAKYWYDHFCQILSESGYFVIRFDHRDTGLSSAIDYENNPYSIDDMAQDALRILDAYGIEKAHAVGHSMGGFIVQHLGIKYASRLHSITSVASGYVAAISGLDEKLSSGEQKIVDELVKVIVANRPTESFEDSLEGFMSTFRYCDGDGDFDEERVLEYIKDLYFRAHQKPGNSNASQNHFSAYGQMVKERSSREGELSIINVPTLIVHGEKEPFAPERFSCAVADEIPGAKLVVIPKMGHLFFNRDIENQLVELISDHCVLVDKMKQV